MTDFAILVGIKYSFKRDAFMTQNLYKRLKQLTTAKTSLPITLLYPNKKSACVSILKFTLAIPQMSYSHI